MDNLSETPVGSYEEIDHKMAEGTKNRTIAATNMNATSSRAHTIVALTFSQKTSTEGTNMTRTAVVNLVDLAGSERAESTGRHEGMRGLRASSHLGIHRARLTDGIYDTSELAFSFSMISSPVFAS